MCCTAAAAPVPPQDVSAPVIATEDFDVAVDHVASVEAVNVEQDVPATGARTHIHMHMHSHLHPPLTMQVR